MIRSTHRRLSAAVRSLALWGICLMMAGLVSGGQAWAQRAAVPAAAPSFGAAPGQPIRTEERIVGVVNDEAISQRDLDARMRLAFLDTGLPDTPETRQRLQPQVLRLLIDERLQLDEAKKNNLVVTDEEVDKEFARLAQQNKSTPEAFEAKLKSAGVVVAALREQMRASLAWQKVVFRRIRPTIEISDDEIDSRLQRIMANVGKPEYLLTEIYISVDSPKNEPDAHRLADRLVEEIAHGANFAAIAQQFSQSATAASGGDLGWVQQGQLEPVLDRALQNLPVGKLSVPLRAAGGYYIFLVRDQRLVTAGDPGDIQVAVGQLVVPLNKTADPQEQAAALKKQTEAAHGCEALEAVGRNYPGAAVRSQPLTRLGGLPAEFAKLLGRLGVGVASDPLQTDAGMMVLMVCERKIPDGSAPPRDQVANMVGGERLDMLQRRKMRDLRRAATIDIRV